MPARTLRLAGETAPGRVLLAEGPDGIQRSFDGGQSWQQVLNAPLASLGAAPNFATSTIAVAGGFRSGIYRSVDGGRIWTLALRDPGSLVAGRNEITATVFTSDTDVIAVQSGGFGWKSSAK